MLCRWVTEGVLDDPFREFLVGVNLETADEDMWGRKFFINTALCPSFIPPELADKVLLTGKSVHFIRHVCADREPIPHDVISFNGL